MWAKIYDLIIKSLLAVEDSVKSQLKKSAIHRNNCFELFGYDIMLDQQMK